MIKRLVFTATLLFSAFTLHAAGPVDINTATAAAIANGVSGIGEVKAEAIVKYREKNGPFKSVDDLNKVSGIGDGTIKKIRDQVTVSVIDKTKK
jgi:competence protein ComEA